MSDVADMLGISTKSTGSGSNTNLTSEEAMKIMGDSKVKSTNTKMKKPKGMSREVFDLIGKDGFLSSMQGNNIGTATVLAASKANANAFKSKRVNALKGKWVWEPITSSARKFNLPVFYHWIKADSAHVDYPYAKFNVRFTDSDIFTQLHPPYYSNEEYDKLFSASDYASYDRLQAKVPAVDTKVSIDNAKIDAEPTLTSPVKVEPVSCGADIGNRNEATASSQTSNANTSSFIPSVGGDGGGGVVGGSTSSSSFATTTTTTTTTTSGACAIRERAWSKQDTDTLIETCIQYDLRWPVIADRIQLQVPRCTEELQARYYFVRSYLLAYRQRGDVILGAPMATAASTSASTSASESTSATTIPSDAYPNSELGPTSASLSSAASMVAASMVGVEEPAVVLKVEEDKNQEGKTSGNDASASTAAVATAGADAGTETGADAGVTTTTTTTTRSASSTFTCGFDLNFERKRRHMQNYLFLRTKDDEVEETRLRDELKSIDAALKKNKKQKLAHAAELKAQQQQQKQEAGQGPNASAVLPSAAAVVNAAAAGKSILHATVSEPAGFATASTTVATTGKAARKSKSDAGTAGGAAGGLSAVAAAAAASLEVGPAPGRPCLQSSRLYSVNVTTAALTASGGMGGGGAPGTVVVVTTGAGEGATTTMTTTSTTTMSDSAHRSAVDGGAGGVKAASATSSSSSNMKNAAAQNASSLVDVHAISAGFGITASDDSFEHTALTSGGRATASSISSGGVHLTKALLQKMNLYLRELDIPETPLPTRTVCDAVEQVKRATVTLLSLHNLIAKKELEYQTLLEHNPLPHTSSSSSSSSGASSASTGAGAASGRISASTGRSSAASGAGSSRIASTAKGRSRSSAGGGASRSRKITTSTNTAKPLAATATATNTAPVGEKIEDTTSTAIASRDNTATLAVIDSNHPLVGLTASSDGMAMDDGAGPGGGGGGGDQHSLLVAPSTSVPDASTGTGSNSNSSEGPVTMDVA